MKQKDLMKLFRQLAMLSQFALSLITPLLLCLGICYLLVSRFGLGGWIFIPGFFFGLGGSGTFAWKFYLAQTREEKKEEQGKKKRVSFNRHT